MRAARALLDWSQETLADKADIGVSTVRDYEAGRREPRPRSIAAMRAALEAEGVMFLVSGRYQGALADVPDEPALPEVAPNPEPAKPEDPPRVPYVALYTDDDD
jgi:transcriptional regulator with XRE-family HTH domain